MNLNKYRHTYQIPKNKLTQILWYFVNNTIFRSPWIKSSKLKSWLLKRFGANIGKDIVIKPQISIKFPWNLTIGDYSWIGQNVFIDNLAKVTIGKNCCISQNAFLETGNHNYKKDTFDLFIEEITIEDNCWVCANATVCPGTIMQTNSILGISSTSIKLLESNYIYVGNPCKKTKLRDENFGNNSNLQ